MTRTLLVVGQGPAGLAVASLLRDVMDVSVVANGASSLTLWSGCWDFGSRLESGAPTRDPLLAWAHKPASHPGRTLSPADWDAIWHTFQSLWGSAGIPTSFTPQNRYVLSARGTLRLTYAVPEWLYVTESPRPLALVEIPGVPDAAMDYVAASYHATTGIQPRVLTLPRPPLPLDSPLRWAAWLDHEDGRHWLMTALPAAGFDRGNDTLVFPGLLGIERTDEVLADLENRVGIQARELTTIPPAVSGMRFHARWRSWLIQEGVRFLPASVSRLQDGEAHLAKGAPLPFDAAVLATGGVLGGGLLRRSDGTVWDTARGTPEEVGDLVHDFAAGVRPGDPFGGIADRIWVVGRQRGGCDPEWEQDGGGTVLASAYETARAIRAQLHLPALSDLMSPRRLLHHSGEDSTSC